MTTQNSTSSSNSPYIGRFAPTPSGALHFGSLVAALSSFLEARVHKGQWLLRIDDIDAPRVVPGAVDEILAALERFGFAWDGPVRFQGQCMERYGAAVEALGRDGFVFACTCTRRLLAERGNHGPYDGFCRGFGHALQGAHSLRFSLPLPLPELCDGVQGVVAWERWRDEMGDFVVRRGDGFYAYHLACAVDDAHEGITHVVRGSDLLPSSFQQRALMEALGSAAPVYAHVPVALARDGQKLSKHNQSRPLDPRHPVPELVQALAFLGQGPPAGLERASVQTVWQWALECWDLARVPRVMGMPVSGLHG